MNDSCVVIVNPAAGSGRAGRAWSRISQQLTQAGRSHVTHWTRRRGDATLLCRDALLEGATTIVAAGGDGTMNEVLNGFWDEDGRPRLGSPDTRLGILPLGTGADFARSLGIGRGARAIPALVAGATIAVDIGRVDFQTTRGEQTHRYFANVADLGLGAKTALLVQLGPRRLGAVATYLMGAIRAVLAYRPQEISITLDQGDARRIETGLIVVANARYFGGGMPVAPPAQLDDGLLDVLQLAPASKRRLLLDELPKLYRGTHLRHPAVEHARAKRITIESATSFPLEVDGEPVGTAPASFTVLPRALHVIAGQSTLHLA
jgi:YegS/Rv2252/BmrU family lipid kinase